MKLFIHILCVGWVATVVTFALYHYPIFCKWKNGEDSIIRMTLFGDPQIEGRAKASKGLHGAIEVIYNDYYLRYIVSRVVEYLRPTHVVVLGDLLSSQLIPTDEFFERVMRYQWIFQPVIEKSEIPFFNIVGNHDIGYAVDVTWERMDRFERAFGPTDYSLFLIPPSLNNMTAVLMVVSNAQVLDTPAGPNMVEFHRRAWAELQRAIALKHKYNAEVIYMLHIPLDKPHGQCADSPVIATTEHDNVIIEQTMMSASFTSFVINTLQPRFIFSGHDHIGCRYEHVTAQTNTTTTEYTIRSMMGDYGGYTAMFEIIPTPEGKYQYHFQYCPFVPLQWVTVLIVINICWPVLFIVSLIAELFQLDLRCKKAFTSF